MRVKTTEKIIITQKESELWNDFDRFIGVVRSEITLDEIEGLIDDLQKIIADLEEYMEVE